MSTEDYDDDEAYITPRFRAIIGENPVFSTKQRAVFRTVAVRLGRLARKLCGPSAPLPVVHIRNTDHQGLSSIVFVCEELSDFFLRESDEAFEAGINDLFEKAPFLRRMIFLDPKSPSYVSLRAGVSDVVFAFNELNDRSRPEQEVLQMTDPCPPPSPTGRAPKNLWAMALPLAFTVIIVSIISLHLF